ncbi:hypothetical protein IIB79_05250 [candidate division KSB1 bacterium]|nr:hypothetical protein [candidate division KSB1 bacterium]
MKQSEKENTTPEELDKPEKIPLGQLLLDDIFLLLALGLTIPLILYIIWGIFDLTGVPQLIP